MKAFLIGFNIHTSSTATTKMETVGESLRKILDRAFAATGEELSTDIITSVSLDSVMFAFPDGTPNRVIRFSTAVQSVIQNSTQIYAEVPQIRAVISFGEVRHVSVKGGSINFEGAPAIAVARILPKISFGILAIDETAWQFDMFTPFLGDKLIIKGKHEDEIFQIRPHNKIEFKTTLLEPKHSADRDEKNKSNYLIGDIISHWINHPLSNTKLVLPNESGWGDVIEQNASKKETIYYTQPNPNVQSREDFIRLTLGHVAVNPHKKRNNEILSETYVYAKDASPEYELLDDDYINKSELTANRFILEIIDRARKARNISLDSHSSTAELLPHGQQDLHTIVHGERGCGKTFLLNHLLTKYSDLFDKERVLWVRLNLVEPFGSHRLTDYTYDLVHRIAAQTAKIVLRYYDENSQFYKGKPYPLSLSPEIMDSIERLAIRPAQYTEYNDKLLAMKYVFGTLGVDQSITPQLIPNAIANILLNLVLKKGYAIICILDGLDQLEASAEYRRVFKRLFESATRLISCLGNLGVGLVSVTRTNTLNSFPDISTQPNPFLCSESPVWRVFPVPFKNILNRRLIFLKEHLPKYSQAYKWTTIDWPDHIYKFQQFMDNKRWDNQYDASLEMFGLNRRAQTQVTQLCYFDFLRQSKERPYLFTESIALAGKKWPPKPYKFQLTLTGNWRDSYSDRMPFDNQLLPSVFNFPFLDWESSKGSAPQLPHPEGILWGIRLLQLVYASDTLARFHSSTYNLTGKDMCILLHKLFNYPINLTPYLISEFAQAELLSVGPYDFELHKDIMRKQLFLLPKGKYVLQYFMYDIAYLSICAMRVPVALNMNPENNSYFYPASLEAIWNASPSWNLNASELLVHWVTAKTINSCAFLRLINRINITQLKLYNEMKDGLDTNWTRIADYAEKGDNEMEGMFEFSKMMQRNLLGQIKGILKSIEREDPRAIDFVQQKVETHRSYWK